jgi:HSP20 family protein
MQRRDDTNPFLSLQREMNRLFDDVFGTSFPTRNSPLMEGRFAWPRIELTEKNDALVITAEIPGMDEKDIQVALADGSLLIRGEKKVENENNEGRLFSERYHGSFERRIPLDGIQEDRVEASLKNGILTITLPKSERASNSIRRITINRE